MLTLSVRCVVQDLDRELIGRVRRHAGAWGIEARSGAVARLASERLPEGGGPRGILPPALHHLVDGDIVRLKPSGSLRVLYQATRRPAVILATEQCTNDCVMCSQPPKDAPDPHVADIMAEMIALMDHPPPEFVVSGGEPLLLGARLGELLGLLRAKRPDVAVQVLTNGRLLRYPALAADLARWLPADHLVAIPLYGIGHHHDATVQAQGAFNETVRGILHAAKAGLRIEIRFVVHQLSLPHLVETARYIARHLPMVDRLAIMALEHTGLTRLHLDALWCDPAETVPRIAGAIEALSWSRVAVRLYGYQLCVLPESLRRYAVSAISDWKREYVAECEGCARRAECGGFFSSQMNRLPSGIGAFLGAGSPESRLPGFHSSV